MYIGCTKFQVILNLKNRVLRKNILVLIPHLISFNLLLILINKNTNHLIPNWLCEEQQHRQIIYIRISFCQSSEQYALKFIRKLEDFINEKYLF